MQCQNEALADSTVGLAADLRRADPRADHGAARRDDEIRDYMVARYGEFILFRPRMSRRKPGCGPRRRFCCLAGLLAAWRVLGKRTRLAANDVAPLEDEAGER